jgi:hypothetical protein
MADKNLTVKIKGDNAGLSRSLKQSKAGISKFGGFLKSFGSKFGLLGAGLVGTAAGGLGAGLSIKVFTGAIEEVDKLTKLGKQFGITTAQVQKFKAAATLSGTNLQQLLKGFGQLSKGIIQFARDGTGPGAKVFEDLGLSADTLKQSFARGPIAVLKTFGEALNKIEDPLVRSALLEEVLGARNKELAVVLADVTNLFASIDKQFQELDLALTKEETDAVELFRDTWAEIGDILDNKVLKAMAKLSGKLQPFADDIKHLLENIIKGGLDGIGASLKTIGLKIAKLGTAPLISATPFGPMLGGAGLALAGAGAVLSGDLPFDKTRAFFARGLHGAFEALEIPSGTAQRLAETLAGSFAGIDKFLPLDETRAAFARALQEGIEALNVPESFRKKIINAVRGSNLMSVIPDTGLEAPRAGTGTINGRRIADIMHEISGKLGQVPDFGGGGLPAPGTGTINGRDIQGIFKESQKQTTALDKLNSTMEKSFFRNERTGKQIAVAAP